MGVQIDDTAAGLRIGKLSSDKIGLWGATPAAQPSGAAQAARVDNSGGATPDGTIDVVTAPTALTDNGGGTADGTVDSQAAPVTVTDSTGMDGTHDDTTADGRRADGTMTGSADGDFELVNDTSTGDRSGEIMNNFKECQAALAILTQNDSDLSQKIIELVTLQGTAQNNLKELTTSQAANRAAIVSLTNAVSELAELANSIRSALVTNGFIKGAA